MPHRVADFMAEHGRKAGFIFRYWQNARVNPDLASRQTKRVGFLAFKHDEFPLRIRERRDGGDALADFLNQPVDGRNAIDGGFLFDLLKTGQPKLHLLSRRHQIQLTATGLRHRRATGQRDNHTAVPNTHLFHGKMKTHRRRGDKRLLCSGDRIIEMMSVLSEAVAAFCRICDKMLPLQFDATLG